MGMTVEEIRQVLCGMFPVLFISPFEVTSPQTINYNCIAWAAGKLNSWLWPGSPYWPDGTPQEDTIRAFCLAYGTLGYSPCDSGDLELGYERIALYVGTDNRVLHAARQLPDGRWTSKLGREWDITHELEGLEGEHYGRVAQFLRRRPQQT